MKKFSQSFIYCSKYLYEQAERISFLIDANFYRPEDKPVCKRLINAFIDDFNGCCKKLVDEEQTDKFYISEALFNYLYGLSYINQDATINNFLTDITETIFNNNN